MKMRNNLDEMQEQELLKIEHNGCWLAFWLLLASLFVQPIIYGEMDFRTIAGEWITFMVLALYLAAACVKKGIWDRRIPMTTGSNLICSLIAGAAIALFNAFALLRQFQLSAGRTALLSLITGVSVFVITFIVLTIMMNSTKKRIKAMEEEPEDAGKM